MAGKLIGLAVLAAGVAVAGAACAQGFSGSGAAGYAQSQGWTASAGVKPKGSEADWASDRQERRVVRRRSGPAGAPGGASGPAPRAE